MANRFSNLCPSWRRLLLALFLPPSVLATVPSGSDSDRRTDNDAQPAVLDIGCGWGDAPDAYRQIGFVTFGMELSDTAAAVVRSRDHRVATGRDESALPVGGSAVKRSRRTVEHTRDPLASSENITKQIASSGIIFLEVPDVTGVVARIFSSYWPHIDPRPHLTIPGRRAAISKLAKLGITAFRKGVHIPQDLDPIVNPLFPLAQRPARPTAAQSAGVG